VSSATSPQAAAIVLWAIRSAAAQTHVPPSNTRVAELARQPQAKRNRRLATDEESRLLHAATPQIYRLIVGALETGCRLGELLALRWQEVDLERRELLVKAEHAKDAQDRVLPISARLAAVLEFARPKPGGLKESSDPVTESEVEVPPGFMNGGVDGTRTRGLRRDRPAF